MEMVNKSAGFILLPIGQVVVRGVKRVNGGIVWGAPAGKTLMIRGTHAAAAAAAAPDHSRKDVILLVLFVAFVVASGVMYSRGGLRMLLAGYAAVASLISVIAAIILLTGNGGYVGGIFLIVGLMAVGVFGLLGAAWMVGPREGPGQLVTEAQPPKR